MLRPFLVLVLLLVAAFGLASGLQPRSEEWMGEAAGSGDVMTLLFRESRKMLASHAAAKADAYFHSGYYPSIFDQEDEQPGETVGGAEAPHNCGFLSPPKDWIDRFSRNFYPSEHRHLGEGAPDDGDHKGHEHADGECEQEQEKAGEELEMLPWIQLAVDLDPEQPELYVMGAYWLRTKLKKVDEAEQFVRKGLRANAGNPDLLFALGTIYREDRSKPDRARNLWELALAGWSELSEEEQQSRVLLHAQLLGNLAKLEEAAGNTAVAIGYLERLKAISPNKTNIEAWIGTLKR